MPEPAAMPAVLIPSGTTENKLRYKQLDQDAHKVRSVAGGGWGRTKAPAEVGHSLAC